MHGLSIVDLDMSLIRLATFVATLIITLMGVGTIGSLGLVLVHPASAVTLALIVVMLSLIGGFGAVGAETRTTPYA